MSQNHDKVSSREREIRGELHELSLNVPRHRKAVTRLLQDVQEKMDSIRRMERRRQQLEEELRQVKGMSR